MDQIKILKRALNIMVNYRVLWVFGILLALTTGGSSGNGGGQFSGDGPDNGSDFNWDNPFGKFPEVTPEVMNAIIAALIVFACVIFMLIVIGTIVYYISETALIRMVDRYENDGQELSAREGFRLGWSSAAWKMFLMDLLTGLAFLAAFFTALMIIALPLLFWLTESTPLRILGTFLSVGLLFMLIFVTILTVLALGLVMLFAHRAVAIEDLGVIESIRRGYHIVKARLVDIIIMGLLMFGLGILWGLVMIPVLLAIVLVAVLAGGLPALLVGGIASLFTDGAVPWIIAAIVGAPIFLVVVAIPALLVEGWQQVFSSSAWTLTYREALALMKTQENAELPMEPVG